MKNISHWTFRYIIERLSVGLFKSKYPDNLPCLAVGAIQFFDGFLKKTDVMFEYGAGYSTTWFAKRVGKIISVESDEKWYNLVKTQIAKYGNAQIYLINSKENKTPLSHVSWQYVNKINEFPKGSFDLILNDGYARPLVALQAIDYLKRGGVFAWDDWGNLSPVEHSFVPGRMKSEDDVIDYMKEFLERINDWRRAIFDDGTHTTALFFKPD